MNQIPYWEDEDDRRYREWVNSFRPKFTPINSEDQFHVDANSIYQIQAVLTWNETEE